MKYRGQPVNARASIGVVIDRPEEAGGPILLQVAGQSMNFDRERRRLWPDVAPPKRFMLDAKGRVMRDPETNEVLTEPDPVPTPEAQAVEDGRIMYMVWSGLKDDPNLEFETPAKIDVNEKPREWAVAMRAEFEAAGFSMGHVVAIQDAMLRASGLKQAVEEAKKGFLPQQRKR